MLGKVGWIKGGLSLPKVVFSVLGQKWLVTKEQTYLAIAACLRRTFSRRFPSSGLVPLCPGPSPSELSPHIGLYVLVD